MGEGIRYDISRQAVNEDDSANLVAYAELGRTIRQPSLAIDLVATSTPAIVPIFQDFILGTTIRETPIDATRLGTGSESIILVGGLHAGYAPNTVNVVEEIRDYYLGNLNEIPSNVSIYIIPSLNPDSITAPGNIFGRLNGNGVDLNRNWDCRWSSNPNILGDIVPRAGGNNPISEAESQALEGLIKEVSPDAVIFWGATVSFGGAVTPGYCENGEEETSRRLVEVMAEKAQYNALVDDELLEANTTLTGDAANWLNKNGIPAAFILLFKFEEYDFGKDLTAIRAVVDAVASGEVSSDESASEQVKVATPTPPISEAPTCPNLPERISQFTDSVYPKHANDLGCAATREIATVGVYQRFEGGTLVWREDRDQVYFLRKNGTYHIENMRQVTDEENYPWSDRLRGAFGYIWYNYTDLRAQLGEPLEDEAGAVGFSIQDFQTGAIFTFSQDGVDRMLILKAKEGVWLEE